MPIIFAREVLEQVVQDITPLLLLHYEELTLHKDRVKLNPHWDNYACLEATSHHALQIFTARDAGALVGYAVFFVQPHPHYRDLLTAHNDLLFVHPQHRGTTGLRLIRYCERQLAPHAHKVLWHVKPGTPLAALLPKLGYGLEEHIFATFLGA